MLDNITPFLIDRQNQIDHIITRKTNKSANFDSISFDPHHRYLQSKTSISFANTTNIYLPLLKQSKNVENTPSRRFICNVRRDVLHKKAGTFDRWSDASRLLSRLMIIFRLGPWAGTKYIVGVDGWRNLAARYPRITGCSHNRLRKG